MGYAARSVVTGCSSSLEMCFMATGLFRSRIERAAATDDLEPGLRPGDGWALRGAD